MAPLARPHVPIVTSAALLVALASGCAYSRSFRCPAEGGPPWVEVESDHFVVKTDARGQVSQSSYDALN